MSTRQRAQLLFIVSTHSYFSLHSLIKLLCGVLVATQ